MLLFAVAGCSGGGAPGSPTGSSAAPTFQLAGRIVDGGSLTAVASATLSAVDGTNAGKTTSTGPDGRYSLVNLVSGGFTLRVQHPGFEDHVQDVTITSNATIDMRLTPRRTVNTGWTGGQLFAIADGAQIGVRLTAPHVTQSGSSVNGTFTGADGGSGSFTGQLAGSQFTGTMRLEILYGTPERRCRGTASPTTGTVTPDTISLSAAALSLEGCSGSVTNITMSLYP